MNLVIKFYLKWFYNVEIKLKEGALFSCYIFLLNGLTLNPKLAFQTNVKLSI